MGFTVLDNSDGFDLGFQGAWADTQNKRDLMYKEMMHAAQVGQHYDTLAIEAEGQSTERLGQLAQMKNYDPDAYQAQMIKEQTYLDNLKRQLAREKDQQQNKAYNRDRWVRDANGNWVQGVTERMVGNRTANASRELLENPGSVYNAMTGRVQDPQDKSFVGWLNRLLVGENGDIF